MVAVPLVSFKKGNTIFGPGAAAGTFAIAFRSIGFVGKLLAEALEEISPAPLQALNATGTPASHVLLKGAWPQIAPAFWGGGNNSQGHPYPR
jgi:phosphonate transport system permease protein